MSSMEDKAKTGDKESAVGGSGTTEVSLSVEETNKLRAALGLKPLQDSTAETVITHTAEDEEKKAKAEIIRKKLQQAKEKRREDAFFAKAAPLADSDSDDDIAAWLQKTKTVHPSNEKETQSVDKTEEGEVEEDEELGIVPELMGAKVKHKPGDLKIGESMILTLTDQPLLTVDGELNTEEDALENTLKAEDARRKRAYAASKPKKDEAFDQFGDKKSLLSKYDEEEEEAMRLEPLEGLPSDQIESIGKSETLHTTLHPISDYAVDETEGDHRVKKRRRQKLRKKNTEMLDIVTELEAQKGDVMDWEADHGTHADRQRHLAEEERAHQQSKAEKSRNFDRALEKANLQALKLKLLEEGDGGDEDDELYDALSQAQQVASQKQERWQKLAMDVQKPMSVGGIPENKKLVFTDTTEFCRLFSSEQIEVKKQEMDEDVMQTAEDRLEKSIETALTHKDHLGRVLTPKEAFREISYAFHGKGPSQKTMEKRKRKMNEDFLAKKTNLDQESQLRRLKAVQKVQKNAFVVLSGAGQIGADIKPKKKKAIKKKTEGTPKPVVPSLTPVLNRGDKDTPLEGKKKVEAMFGFPVSDEHHRT